MDTHTHSHRFILSVNKRSDKETRVTNGNAANLYCVCVIALMATANIECVCVCVLAFYFYLLFFKVIVLLKFYSMNGNGKCVSDDGVLLHIFFFALDICMSVSGIHDIGLSWTDSFILNSWRQCINTMKVWNVISVFWQKKIRFNFVSEREEPYEIQANLFQTSIPLINFNMSSCIEVSLNGAHFHMTIRKIFR